MLDNLQYRHYSEHKFTLNRYRKYNQHIESKPFGLWLSIETPDDDVNNWYDWCIYEGYDIHRLRHIYEVKLKPDNNLLYLTTQADVLLFSKNYRLSIHHAHKINWVNVSEKYDGIVIYPYLWTLRLNTECIWYSPWDVASACIWNLEVIEDMTLTERK